MTHEGEASGNPSYSAASTEGDAIRSMTTKRPREESDVESSGGVDVVDFQPPPLKRRVKVEYDVLFRLLLPSRQIGKVIGKEGYRIQKIREDTKAAIKIADAISRHEERVIIISSKDSDNIYCDAEIALHHIANVILNDDDCNNEALKTGSGHAAANTIRLLIAGSQAGGLIGVSGQNIEKLRNSSGATITVLAQNQLPVCASAHESDRVVQLSGDVPAVLKALVQIGCELRDNPPKQVISISPTYNLGFTRSAQTFIDPSSAEYVTLEMMIPETFAGGLIGRCGSNISRIRSESGAAIKVYGAKGEQKHRQIHLGGSAQQVALAKQRIDEYVYSQLIQSGGQQSIDYQAGIMAALAPTLAATTANHPMHTATDAVTAAAAAAAAATNHPMFTQTAANLPMFTPSATNIPMFTPTATNIPVFTPGATGQAPAYYGRQTYHGPSL